MGNKKKGLLTYYAGYEKHLRKFYKRQFWKGERFEEKKELNKVTLKDESDISKKSK